MNMGPIFNSFGENDICLHKWYETLWTALSWPTFAWGKRAVVSWYWGIPFPTGNITAWLVACIGLASVLGNCPWTEFQWVSPGLENTCAFSLFRGKSVKCYNIGKRLAFSLSLTNSRCQNRWRWLYYSVFLFSWRATNKLSSEAGNGEVTNPK